MLYCGVRSVTKFVFAFQAKGGRARPGGVLAPMVVTDLLDSILEPSSVVWGFPLFKDNIAILLLPQVFSPLPVALSL